MTAADIISQYYGMLTGPNITNSEKADIFYNIIFTKNAEGQSDIYVDTKEFLKYYILSVDEKNYGYDRVDNDKIVGVVQLLRPGEKVNIWQYFKRLCIKFQSENEWKVAELHYYNAKKEVLKENKFWFINPLLVIRFFYYKTICSYWALVAFITIVIIVEIIVTSPNTYNLWPSLFEVKYEPIFKSFWENHVINILLNLLEFDTDFKIIPLNIVGAILLILSKIFKVLFVIKYLVDTLIKKLNLDE